MEPRRIGIFPARERDRRSALFAALEEALPVRFEGRRSGDHAGLDAAILFPSANAGTTVLLPQLVALADEGPAEPPPPLGVRPVATGPAIELADASPLDERLRGARLRDATVAGRQPVPLIDGDVVLGAWGGKPVWVQRATPRGPAATVAVSPGELDEGEALRDRVRNGRFLAVVALVHFLRAVCGSAGWTPPPLHACFLFDDPNLHWTSYGHLRYRDLVREADRHDYHMAFATVPLDGWFAHPAAARLFRSRPDRFSLVVHGNNHDHRELARPAAAPEAQGLLTQALRRIAAFERRSGLHVARIMVPPHGVCSRELARSLVPVGFEALCISRPYPWLARPPQPWLVRPAASSPLTGWDPAAVVENGLPVLLRRGIDDPIEDLALRAFLDQPLIVQGHHQDVRGGLDKLAEVANVIHRLGEVQWTSLREIARSNVTRQQEGEGLSLRMFTRHAEVDIAGDVGRVAIELPRLDPTTNGDAVAWSTWTSGGARLTGLIPIGDLRREIKLPPAARRLEVRLVTDEALLAAPQRMPSLPLRSVARRFATEARDRLAPASYRLKLRLTGAS